MASLNHVPVWVSGHVDPEVQLQTVLDALDDDTSRKILAALDEPRTAQEVAETCDLPLSTVYRKLGGLSETCLVEERTRFRNNGHHASQYQRTFEEITLDVHADGMGIDIVPREALSILE